MTDDFEVIEQLAVVGHHGGDGFPGINGAAAAETDDEIALRRARECDALRDGVEHWLACDRKEDIGDAVLVEKVNQRCRASRRTPRDDQRASTEVARNCADLRKRAGAEDDPCDGSELE